MKKHYTLKEKLMSIGPGMLIVGSFIGPGTVTSATRAGANHGYSLFWCVIFSVIAVIVLQGMASRLGIITQKGLAENLVDDFKETPALQKTLCWLVAISIAIGGFAYMAGDLTGTSIGISALTGISPRIIAPLWGVCILIMVTFAREAVKFLEKLLGVCVSIMAVVFVITMVVVKPDLGQVFSGIIPTIPNGGALYCVSLIGTTVVPYNLYLHAASSAKTWHKPEELELARFSTNFSMVIGGVVTSAILITSATVMQGMTVSNAMDMAVQLEPTLGSFAEPFMAIGLIAAGISSAVCTPLGVSYVFAGLFGWETNKSDKRYTITNTAVLITGIVLAAVGWDPLALIIAAQAVNGVILPVSVGVVLYLTSRKNIMGEHKNNTLQNILGLAVFGISLVIGINSLVSLF